MRGSPMRFLALLSTVLLFACADAGVTAPADTLIDTSTQADTSLEPDTSVNDVSQVDAGVDTAEPDAGPTCEPGTGCFGESCDEADDCNSGICTAHMGDKVCSKTCDATCPDGWQCVLVGGATDWVGMTFLRVLRHTPYAQPSTGLYRARGR